jgi:hypothetical protein
MEEIGQFETMYNKKINKVIDMYQFLYKENNNNIINILCYHVNKECKYPFMQIMMEKLPYCYNLIEEKLILPYITNLQVGDNLEEKVLEKVKEYLIKLDKQYIKCLMNNEMYKGIWYNNTGKPFIIVDITSIDISYLFLSRKDTVWFVLPSEILNGNEICNIKIEKDVINLFNNEPTLGLIWNSSSNQYYVLPEVGYTGDEMKKVEFKSVFGNIKSKEYNLVDEYYFFYNNFNKAVKEGGWKKVNETEIEKYKEGGINRYAIFVDPLELWSQENLLVLEDNNNEDIDSLVISQKENNIKPNVLVRKYNNFYPLSCHGLNKSLLGDLYIKDKKYMIR